LSNRDPMRGWVSAFPEMLEEAWRVGIPSPSYPLDAGRSILLGGMGGSGMAGAIASVCLERRGSPAITCRDTALPKWLGSQDRFVLSSYSGQTQEALAMLREAIARAVPTRVIASGGPILSLCSEARVPVFKVPDGLAPRASLPWLLAGVLRATGGVDDLEIAAAIRALRDEQKSNAPERDPVRIAEDLAGRLVCLLPFGSAMEIVALRWRNQILENAKQGSFVSPLPEMAHNEVMGWSWLRDAAIPLSFVILVEEWPLPSPWGGLVEALKEEAAGQGFPVRLVPPGPEGGLAGLLEQVLLGDRVSVELSERRGVDATPVAAIQRLRGAYGKELRP
jgi:glucose/mannose-6-phosphate isomerase